MNNKESVSLMIDMETLGVSRDSVVLQVGIILFDEDFNIIKEYVKYGDITDQIKKGREVRKETVEWWKRTNKDFFYSLIDICDDMTVTSDLYVELSDLMDTINDNFKVVGVWSRGYLDFELLNSFLTKKVPYYLFRDVRTLDTFGEKRGDNPHDALQDCVEQLKYIRRIFKKWNALHAEMS